MRKFGKFLYAVSIAVAVAGCSSTPKTEPGAAVEERAPGSGAQPVETPPVAMVAPPKVEESVLAELKDPKSILSKRSVFFEFDKYDIRDEFKPLVEAHARFLVSHPKIKMLIQGNADERGSREYNVALGQKRAEAVKKALTLLGAKEEQVESVSLGKEKPRNAGHDEAAWAENRRGDILYSGEY
jgi:peptidoglycan-associated lipoprotein